MGIKSRGNFPIRISFCQNCGTVIDNNILCSKCYNRLSNIVHDYESPANCSYHAIPINIYYNAIRLIREYEKEN